MKHSISSLLKPTLLACALISFPLTATHAQSEREIVAIHLKKVLDPVSKFFDTIVAYKNLVKPIIEESLKAHQTKDHNPIKLTSKEMALLNTCLAANPLVLVRINLAQRSLKEILSSLSTTVQAKSITPSPLVKFLEQSGSIVEFCDKEVNSLNALAALCSDLSNLFADVMKSLSPAAQNALSQALNELKHKTTNHR